MRRQATMVVYSTTAALLTAIGARVAMIPGPEKAVAASITSSSVGKLPLSHQIADLPPWPRPLFRTASVSNDEVTGTIKGGTDAHEQKIALVGVIVESRQRLAVILHAGKIRRVRETETVGPWTLTKIEPRTATLRRGTELRELLLDPPLAK
jgi:hypothetical protein